MKRTYDLGTLEWTLSGWTPYVWRQQRSIESGTSHNADVPPVPARVPGSVQGSLRAAGIIPDWNQGLDARQAEWVENRHWIYTARIPAGWLSGCKIARLRALGLDYQGWVLMNGEEIGSFKGSLVPHVFDLSRFAGSEPVILQVVFGCPPRWLGQIGYTSEMREWKPRFNYFWDWTSRLVQSGIWDDLVLETGDGEEIVALDCRTGAQAERSTGSLQVSGLVAGERGARVRLSLEGTDRIVRSEQIGVKHLVAGFSWDELPVELWWPNGEGGQSVYTLRVSLLDAYGNQLDEATRKIGFASMRWESCDAAPEGADPWLFVINGRPIFLQGVNWTPILPNFADVRDEDYRRLLETYRDLGCNMLRVWGGAFLEKEVFYDLCDELGLLVWQEFPLSSSGLENRPPDDPRTIEELAFIADSYIQRRSHHVALAVWCGGNELQEADGTPVNERHPLIARLAGVCARHDPGRRFLPASPSGPSFGADAERFGAGVHWDVHGPWNAKGDLGGGWTRYWENIDALFHSEIGAPGASSLDVIREYSGGLPEVPGTHANPLWRRTSWWIEWPVFEREHGREPLNLEEYVNWSQRRQQRALRIAAAACKARFPRCGGFLVWMGHDSFPCTANTSIIDFQGKLKPAAQSLRDVFRADRKPGPSGETRHGLQLHRQP